MMGPNKLPQEKRSPEKNTVGLGLRNSYIPFIGDLRNCMHARQKHHTPPPRTHTHCRQTGSFRNGKGCGWLVFTCVYVCVLAD